MTGNKLENSIFSIDPRIDLIQNEYFYEFNQAFECWNKFMILMKQSKVKTKIKGLLITGAPDSGKSTLVRQFLYEYSQNVEG